MTLLNVERLSISFRRYDGLLRQKLHPVIENLSFELRRGEVFGLIGASGAGKSLLAHVMFGILPENAVTSGSVMLSGRSLCGPRRVSGQAGRIALVPQSISHLDPLVQCSQHLLWAAERAGRPLKLAQATALLERFGLEADVMRLYPHQLSGGMARRLLLAMAATAAPELIVADEPTSGLDRENATTVLRYLRDQAVEGAGVLLITHDLAHVLPFADRVGLLRDGQLVGIEAAEAFSGAGLGLRTDYARRLWQAMPQNAFATEARAYARSA